MLTEKSIREQWNRRTLVLILIKMSESTYFEGVEIVDLFDVEAFTFKVELSVWLWSEVVELSKLACHYLKIN